MVTPLIVPPLLTQLNNLPGFPPSNTFKLGDALNNLTNVAVGFAVVFRPGGPLPLPINVYSTWATAFAAVKAVSGNRTILIDSTYAPALVPAGTYDFETTIIIVGPDALPQQTLSLANGVVFQNFQQASGFITIISLSAAPIITVAVPLFSMILDFNAHLQANGAAPFISVSAGAALGMILLNSAELLSGVSKVIDLPTATSAAIILTLGAASVVQDVVSGIAGSVLQIGVDNVYTTITVPQTGFAGTFQLIYDTSAGKLGYSPFTPGDWAFNPTNVQEALDRIAAAVAGLLGGPIP